MSSVATKNIFDANKLTFLVSKLILLQLNLIMESQSQFFGISWHVS